MPGSTARYVGVDGCKAGWVGIGLYDDCACDEKGWDKKVCKKFGDLIEHYAQAKLILVDMPIGLPNDEDLGGERIKYRPCDKQARGLLGSPRKTSVFPVPTRELAREVAEENPLQDINEELDNRNATKMSPYSYGITPKIAEIDNLTSSAQCPNNVREIHPELCFWALNKVRGKDGAMRYGKTDGLGFLERWRILKIFVPETERICEDIRSSVPSQNKVGADDMLDALVAAMTAKLGCQNQQYELRRLPNNEVINWYDPSNGPEMIYVARRPDV